MPELPEVETVKETLKKRVLNKKILDVTVLYDKTIEHPSVSLFKEQIINQTINDVKRRGKWLIFVLDDYFLLSHLRMEGKYNVKQLKSEYEKHEHVSFVFDEFELRYKDTRKFGKMHLYGKGEKLIPLDKLGPEYGDLTVSYLADKYKNKRLPIKTVILDQTIITGIGNIYADEILFMSRINPFKKTSELNTNDIKSIIENTKIVLEKAIILGGTTIRSYTSSEGISGRFQNELLVHAKEGDQCPVCNATIIKTKIGGRGTYYCPVCQK